MKVWRASYYSFPDVSGKNRTHYSTGRKIGTGIAKILPSRGLVLALLKRRGNGVRPLNIRPTHNLSALIDRYIYIYLHIDLDICFVESPSSLAWIRDDS